MDLRTIIKEQKEELNSIERRERIVGRELLEDARNYLKHPNILAVVGIRRCGKSIFSYLLVRNERFGYVNFDDERLADFKAEDLNKILQAFYELYDDVDYIVLDEIQNVNGWELFANRLRRTKKVIITGSNSKFLGGELSTHLTGRYIDIMLSPFSFREFINLKNMEIQNIYTTRQKSQILRLLEDYLTLGGFPEVDKFGRVMLSRIYEDIITKDILLRYKLKKMEKFRELARYLLTNFCQEISYRKLINILGIKHVSTISNWITYLENSFLIYKLERFSFKLKQQFIAPKKIYCIDNGIVNMVAFGFSENKGYFMENAVASELKRVHSQEFREVYYWKDYQHNEVDFVVKDKKKILQLIQVSYIADRKNIREREIKSLLKASQELNCNNLLIVTWDFESEERYGGKVIRFVPLWKWLLFNSEFL